MRNEDSSRPQKTGPGNRPRSIVFWPYFYDNPNLLFGMFPGRDPVDFCAKKLIMPQKQEFMEILVAVPWNIAQLVFLKINRDGIGVKLVLRFRLQCERRPDFQPVKNIRALIIRKTRDSKMRKMPVVNDAPPYRFLQYTSSLCP
jgi:hypothetical protein